MASEVRASFDVLETIDFFLINLGFERAGGGVDIGRKRIGRAQALPLPPDLHQGPGPALRRLRPDHEGRSGRYRREQAAERGAGVVPGDAGRAAAEAEETKGSDENRSGGP